MPWVLNEDGALKSKLTGLAVPAEGLGDALPVDVRFTVPEDEFSDFTYPLITLTHASIERDPERESRGYSELISVPENLDPEAGPYFADMPVPYNIDYQVMLYTRLVEHRTYLVAQLAAFDYLPERFGYLQVPQDQTVRRLDLVGGPQLNSGRDSNNKRLFTATYRIRVSTELFLLGAPVTFPDVQTIGLTVNDIVPDFGD
jgi:hypothetical protein